MACSFAAEQTLTLPGGKEGLGTPRGKEASRLRTSVFRLMMQFCFSLMFDFIYENGGESGGAAVNSRTAPAVW